MFGVLCQNLGHLRGAAPRLSPELELESSVLFYLINLGVRAQQSRFHKIFEDSRFFNIISLKREREINF